MKAVVEGKKNTAFNYRMRDNQNGRVLKIEVAFEQKVKKGEERCK